MQLTRWIKSLLGGSWRTRQQDRLTVALALSIFIHGLILSLKFGAAGLGWPVPWLGQRTKAPELSLRMEYDLRAVPSENAAGPGPLAVPPPVASAEPPKSGTPPRGPFTFEVRLAQRAEPAPSPQAQLSLPRREARTPAPAARARAAERKVRPKPARRMLARTQPQPDTFKVPPAKVAEAEPQRAPESAGRRQPEEPVAAAQRTEDVTRQQADETARLQAEEAERQRAEEEARQRALALQKEAEAKKLAEARRLEETRKQEEARLQAALEARKLAEETARQETEELARQRTLAKEQEAKRLEDARRIEEARKQEEAARAAELKKQEEAARVAELKKQEEARRLALEAEALKRAEEARRIALEAEALKRAEELARQQAIAREQEAAARRQAEEAAARAEKQKAEAQAAAQRERDRLAAQPGPGPSAGPAAPLSGKELAQKAIDQLRTPGAARDELLRPPAPPLRSADTLRRRAILRGERDVSLRMYADSWRWKIERSGAVNYRSALTWRGAHENPIVTISIRSDGTLEDVVIDRSSGIRELDEAVRRIARLHAPYSKFPPDLARQYDVIQIRRVWFFDDTLRILDEM